MSRRGVCWWLWLSGTDCCSLEQSVRDDLAVLKKSPLIKREIVDNAHGFIFDIKTGLLSAVEV